MNCPYCSKPLPAPTKDKHGMLDLSGQTNHMATCSPHAIPVGDVMDFD